MGLVETIILVLFGLLTLALAYILFIPINVQISLVIEEKVQAYSSFKAFPFKKQIYPSTPGEEKEKKPKEPKKKEEEKPEEESQFAEKKKFDFSALNKTDIKMLLGVVGEIFKMVGRLLKAPDYYLIANFAGGVEEPDVTGEIYGAYHAVRPNLPSAVKLNYVPDFYAGKFNGNISCGLVVTIFGLIWEVIVFIIRLPKIKLFKLYRKLKTGRKNGK